MRCWKAIGALEEANPELVITHEDVAKKLRLARITVTKTIKRLKDKKCVGALPGRYGTLHLLRRPQ